MRHIWKATVGGILLVAAFIPGCGSGPEVNREQTTSAIRAAEEVGVTGVPQASLYLQLAKEELENAKRLAANDEKDEAESMLRRSEADAELAVALSRSDADKTEAANAIERVRQLRKDNNLPPERN